MNVKKTISITHYRQLYEMNNNYVTLWYQYHVILSNYNVTREFLRWTYGYHMRGMADDKYL